MVSVDLFINLTTAFFPSLYLHRVFYLVGIEMTSHVASYPSHFIAGYKIWFCFYGNSVWETTVWATFICSCQNETTCDVWLCVMGQLCSHD